MWPGLSAKLRLAYWRWRIAENVEMLAIADRCLEDEPDDEHMEMMKMLILDDGLFHYGLCRNFLNRKFLKYLSQPLRPTLTSHQWPSAWERLRMTCTDYDLASSTITTALGAGEERRGT